MLIVIICIKTNLIPYSEEARGELIHAIHAKLEKSKSFQLYGIPDTTYQGFVYCEKVHHPKIGTFRSSMQLKTSSGSLMWCLGVIKKPVVKQPIHLLLHDGSENSAIIEHPLREGHGLSPGVFNESHMASFLVAMNHLLRTSSEAALLKVKVKRNEPSRSPPPPARRSVRSASIPTTATRHSTTKSITPARSPATKPTTTRPTPAISTRPPFPTDAIARPIPRVYNHSVTARLAPAPTPTTILRPPTPVLIDQESDELQPMVKKLRVDDSITDQDSSILDVVKKLMDEQEQRLLHAIRFATKNAHEVRSPEFYYCLTLVIILIRALHLIQVTHCNCNPQLQLRVAAQARLVLKI